MERLSASEIVMVARTHKRPESALSKISFGRGVPELPRLESQTPRAPDATGAHRRTHRCAAGRASPASRGRRSVRKAAAKGRNPTICGPEAAAPAALRRTPHAAHAGEALCWAGARAPPESLGVICVHTPLAAQWRSGRHLTVLILTHYLSILSGAYSNEPSDCHRGSTREKLHHWHETRMPPVRF